MTFCIMNSPKCVEMPLTLVMGQLTLDFTDYIPSKKKIPENFYGSEMYEQCRKFFRVILSQLRSKANEFN